ncbi:DoxX family protein [Alkalihalobacterium chitinilyticum]|uniref:DoxX family protein n=1 Tax=Alkalihalobacterium chitinilyticum TaxID=2980103 RepID=A0ABT5VF38_9BACI|nr:DoxX family protein [Alkalihalobacterium chitinilyticum]MDE5414078.1 DoxX family protein [Alkalihalobacterium chitinilyticum]
MLRKFEFGAFILRVVLGLIFFIHGLDKFQGGMAHTVSFFESVGLPGFLAYVVASIELAGGMALLVGIGTRVVSILFAIIMIGAIITVKLPAGFQGGYEFDLALLAMSFHLAITNRSKYALDNVMISYKYE